MYDGEVVLEGTGEDSTRDIKRYNRIVTDIIELRNKGKRTNNEQKGELTSEFTSFPGTD